MSTAPSKISAGEIDGVGAGHDLLSFLLEHIPDRIYFKDRESRFLRISHAMAEFFSLKDPAEAIGRTDFDFFTREHAQPAFDDEQRIIASGTPLIGKVEKETLPDGRVGWCITTKMPLRDQHGAIVGTCGISKDFTVQKNLEDSLERSNALLAAKQTELQHTLDELRKTHEQLKAAQRQLIDAEKIQSLGRLAFGVAHEVRNPLNILNMAVEFLGGQAAITADPTTNAIVATMKDAVARADAVVTELMDASGAAELTRELHQIEPVIRSAVARYEERLTRAGIALEMDVPPGLPDLSIDPKRIEETLSGILQNAFDAMPTGGRLTIRASEQRVQDAESDVGSRSARKLRAGDRIVRIEIADTGAGIPKERIDDIFDPFFTTKATGEGVGLGLTVCRKIVELHGGRITVASKESEGACISIDLPVEDKSAATR